MQSLKNTKIKKMCKETIFKTQTHYTHSIRNIHTKIHKPHKTLIIIPYCTFPELTNMNYTHRWAVKYKNAIFKEHKIQENV